jgi:hypothetical protein
MLSGVRSFVAPRVVPAAAELIDQNFVNTLQSAKLQLRFIREQMTAARQMRAMRHPAVSPFEYTQNPFARGTVG